MNKDRYQRIAEIFHEASNLVGDARDAFLSRACAGDAQLRHEVELLLHQDHAGGDAFGESRPGVGRELLADAIRTDAATESTSGQAAPLPETIGRYRIIQRIGQGGMGTVYAAEQDHPQRRVALKMIRPGALSGGMLRRFQQEADLLGRLQHPGIAQIYEAGAVDTEIGRQPYFAMEYVGGIELRKYVKQHELGTRERLELLARICDAVHHAHQKAIIHRDLKPDNVLIVDEPAPVGATQYGTFAKLGQPKVLDFGVARATDSDIQMTTMHTDVGQLVGTISYMSPEQVNGDARELDTRSDIYTLGVILYELLSGRLPHDLKHKSVPEAARIIREEDPTHLSSVNTVFRGDIDTIVSKALERDRERRYASAAEMAADIRRHLAHEPIAAHPPSTFYQLRKFGKRNRGLVAGLGLAAFVLVAGVVTSLTFAVRAARGEKLASENERQALLSQAAARRAAYFASITAAEAMSDTDPLQALEQLEAAPREYRGWEWRHLTARFHACLAEYAGDSGDHNASTVARRADGALVAALARDGVIELVVLDSGDVWTTIRGDRELTTPDLSPDASRLVAVDRATGKLVVWDVPGGQRVLELPIDSVYLTDGATDTYSARFSQDGSLIALGSDEYELTVRETATGRVRFRTAIAGKHRNKFAFDIEGRRIAVVSPDNYGIRVLSVTGECVASRRLNAEGISLAFSPDGAHLAIGQVQRRITILDATTLEDVDVLSGHEWWVRALAFSPDGAFLASSSDDGTTRIWNLATGETARVLPGPVSTSLAFSEDSAFLAGGSASQARLWAWTRNARNVLRGHKHYVYQIVFSPDGTLIASNAWDDTVRLWNALTGEPLAILPVARAAYNALAFTRDGTRLIACDDFEMSEFTVWDTATGIRLVKPHTTTDETLFQDLSRADSRRDRRFARAAGGGSWNAQNRNFASSPDGSLLAEGAHQGEFRIVDAATGTVVDRLADDAGGPFWSAAFDLSGTRLALAGATGTVTLWDLARAELLATLHGHVGIVYAVNFSPDGARVVSGGNDGTIMLWDAQTYDRVAVLRGHEDYLYTVAFSPDGTMLASASGDGTVRIWDSVPPEERWRQIRQDQELRREAAPLVDNLLDELAEPLDVADRLRADETLSYDYRRAALHVLLKRSTANADVGEAF